MTVVGVVLAAGTATRMGSPKQLLQVGGRPMLQLVVDAASAAGLEELLVVLGHAADAVAAGIRLPGGCRVVVNPRHAEGRATSLAAGLAAAPSGAEAALVLLGDQPEVRPDAIRALLAARRAGGPPVLRAAYRGRPGHPVLLERSRWGEAVALRGEGGARVIVARDPAALGLVEVGGDPPASVDTPDDLRRLLLRGGRSPAAGPGAGSGTRPRGTPALTTPTQEPAMDDQARDRGPEDEETQNPGAIRTGGPSGVVPLEPAVENPSEGGPPPIGARDRRDDDDAPSRSGGEPREGDATASDADADADDDQPLPDWIGESDRKGFGVGQPPGG